MRIRKARRRAENRRFLADLARTGNARLTAARLGVHRGTFFKRRARDPDFAAAWQQALAKADAALDPAEVTHLSATATSPARRQLRTGRHRIGRAQEDAFLEALDATNNLRMAADQTGFAHSSILARARRSHRFARELAIRRRIAADRLLATGILEAAKGLTFSPENEPRDPTPEEMSYEQMALQLIYHDKDGRLQRHHERGRWRHHDRDLAAARRTLWALIREAHFRTTGSWRFEDE